GSNAKGTYADVPKDTFWALGLGDSFVVVCPSLDLVAVRLGVGAEKSQLPGDGQWGKGVGGVFRLRVKGGRDPGPPNPVIKGIAGAPKDAIVRRAKGGDNWPLTWADDGDLYAAYGDGNGFEPQLKEKLSLGFAKVSGSPPDFTGVNF